MSTAGEQTRVHVTESIDAVHLNGMVHFELSTRLNSDEYLSHSMILSPEVAYRLGKALIEMAALVPEPVVA